MGTVIRRKLMMRKISLYLAWFVLFFPPADSSPIKSVEFGRPEVHITSPLYDAYLDTEYHMLARLTCTVTKADVSGNQGAERNWWTPKDLSPVCLEDSDYVGSGYQRGHVRALRWSAGNDHWPDVNMLGVIVPQLPEVNNGAIKNLESHVVDLANSHSPVSVTVICQFGSDRHLKTADEPHRIPDAFFYRVTYTDSGKEITERYLIRNEATFSPDYTSAKVSDDP